MLDTTGAFHWCPGQALHVCTLTAEGAARKNFHNHIIVGVIADKDSSTLGLKNLIMPLRASNIRYNDLMEVVILGDPEYIAKEWKLLRNFCKLYFFSGSVLTSLADLRILNINRCRRCILLSSKAGSREEPVLADKEIIMAALNIRSMKFEAAHGITDGRQIPLLLDLAFASNVHYIDAEKHEGDRDFRDTLPFASGMATCRGILDSLVSAAYFNASALLLTRQWVTGGATLALEESLAEGEGLQGGPASPQLLEVRNRFRMEEIRLYDSPFKELADSGASFAELFSVACRRYGIICIAIYRKIPDEESGIRHGNVRVVMSCPDAGTELLYHDHVIGMVQVLPQETLSLWLTDLCLQAFWQNNRSMERLH